MSKSTILAEGEITRNDRLVIELSESIETPAAVLLIWPPPPSVTDPAKLPVTANAAMPCWPPLSHGWPRSEWTSCS